VTFINFRLANRGVGDFTGGRSDIPVRTLSDGVAGQEKRSYQAASYRP